jgi:polyhydroxybutyrate depolymerase
MRCRAWILGLAVAGCGGGKGAMANADATSSGDAMSTDASKCAGFVSGPIGGSRPVSVYVPASYTCTPMPLVVMLHGYSGSGAIEEAYVQLTAQADARGFLYAHPDGTRDTAGNEFWNATDACCDLYGASVDDSSYLSGLITEIGRHYSVDPKRVFLVGHSNGGFMSYRMACDHADQIAAIASLAGAMYQNVASCTPVNPVAVLEIHGTSDTVIAYDGGLFGGHAYPSAPTTVSDWVAFDGCSSTPDTSAPPLDLDSMLAGSETTVTSYATGCQPGGHAELWSIQGGSHVPSLSTSFTPAVVDFLLAHPKP